MMDGDDVLPNLLINDHNPPADDDLPAMHRIPSFDAQLNACINNLEDQEYITVEALPLYKVARRGADRRNRVAEVRSFRSFFAFKSRASVRAPRG